MPDTIKLSELKYAMQWLGVEEDFDLVRSFTIRPGILTAERLSLDEEGRPFASKSGEVMTDEVHYKIDMDV